MADETVKTKITDDALESLRKQIGVRRGQKPNDEKAKTSRILRSQIRHQSVVLGDMRPLFVDLEYAQKSPWRTLVCPQGVLIHEEQYDPEIEGLPGSKAVVDAVELEWHLPIRLGDSLFSETVISDVDEVSQAANLGRAVSLNTVTETLNQDRQLVGTTKLKWTCYERGSGGQQKLFGGRDEPYMWENQEIDALGEEYKQEKQRGAEALTWEEVNVGDEPQYVLKGPTTHHKYMGAGITRWYWGQAQGFEVLERTPELFFKNENNMDEPLVGMDANHHRAQRWGGVPGALEENKERVYWLLQVLMNWMGDAGFISRANLTFPAQNMVGDVTRGYGRVTGKRQEDGRGVVELEVWQDNELGVRVTQGTVEVILPLASS